MKTRSKLLTIGAVSWIVMDTAPRVLSGFSKLAVDPIVSYAIIGSVQALHPLLGVDWEMVKSVGELARIVRVVADVGSAGYAAYGWLRNLRSGGTCQRSTDGKS